MLYIMYSIYLNWAAVAQELQQVVHLLEDLWFDHQPLRSECLRVLSHLTCSIWLN